MSVIIDVKYSPEGVPTLLFIRSHHRRVKVSFTDDQLKIEGRLNEEILGLIKLFYPYSKIEKDFFESGYLAEANASVTGAATTTLYTVPQGKKLYILNAYLSSAVIANVGSNWGGFLYVMDIKRNESMHLTGHRIVTSAIVGTLFCNNVGFINYGFPAGFQITVYTYPETRNAAGFMGLLKDA